MTCSNKNDNIERRAITKIVSAAILTIFMLGEICVSQKGTAQNVIISSVPGTNAPDLKAVAVRTSLRTPHLIKIGDLTLWRVIKQGGLTLWHDDTADDESAPKSVWIKNDRQFIHGLLSPDGKWVLEEASINDFHDFQMFRIQDGFSCTRHPHLEHAYWVSGSDALWLPDSRHWVQLFAGKKSLYTVIADRSSDAWSQKAIGLPRGTQGGWDLMQSYLLGFIGPGCVLATCDKDGDPNDQVISRPFYSFRLGAGADQVKAYSIFLPPGAREIENPVLSPDGTRTRLALREKAARGE